MLSNAEMNGVVTVDIDRVGRLALPTAEVCVRMGGNANGPEVVVARTSLAHTSTFDIGVFGRFDHQFPCQMYNNGIVATV